MCFTRTSLPATARHPVAWDTEVGRPSLAALLAQLGTDRLEVFSAPRRLGSPVRTAVIWDGVGAITIQVGDLVLGVGVTGAVIALDGPVEIDDTAMQPLAYSNVDDSSSVVSA